MRYLQWAPGSRLAPFVECFWSLDGRGSGDTESVLPDGTVELIFHLHDSFGEVRPNGRDVQQPRAIVAGQLSAALILRPGSAVRTVGVRLRSAAARAITGMAASALTDRIEDLRDVNARLAREVPDDGTSTLPAFAANLERGLVSALEGCSIDAETAGAVAAIERHGGCASIDHICAETRLHRRDLERRFARDVGLSPKRFSRLVRFRRAVRALASGDPTLVEAALSAGYYDQPHFTREFTSIAGKPPAAWLSSEQELARYFCRAGAADGRSE